VTAAPPGADAGADVFAGVAGQPGLVAALRAAVAAPVHAYLLAGPSGAGPAAAATAFAAALLCSSDGCGHCRDCRLALAGGHPDAATFAPEGAYLRLTDAEEISRVAARSPVEGGRKVLILTDFHRVREVGPALLKTIEEPPASTVFVILADTVPPELVTIASRCVRIDVAPLPPSTLAQLLVAEGVPAEQAGPAADAAAGSLDRARLLVSDAGLAARREAWARLPERLDGTGAAVAVAVSELLELVEAAAEPLRRAQAAELAELEERVAASGGRGSGRSRLEASHRRALRRHRTDDLRFGLATLAGRYRDALVGSGADVAARVAAVDAVNAAAEALTRNPNEPLLLQALFLRLPSLPPAPARFVGTSGG
jgi:DNA polymerase-3 subunit delta'